MRGLGTGLPASGADGAAVHARRRKGVWSTWLSSSSLREIMVFLSKVVAAAALQSAAYGELQPNRTENFDPIRSRRNSTDRPG